MEEWGGREEREKEGKGERERQNMLTKEVVGEEGGVIRKISSSPPLKHLRHFTA